MATREYIERQITFTGIDCVVPAALDQAFDTCKPYTDIGFIIVSHLAPNTSAYPELKRFLWAECTELLVLTGNYYYYASSGWTLLNLTDGAQLLPQTVLLSALSAQGGSPGDIIQVDSTADGFIFTNLASAFVNGTLDPAKLIPGANGQLLSIVGGSVAWITFDSAAVIATIANGTFPIAKLQPGTAKYVLRTNTAGDAVEYIVATAIFDDGTLPLAKLAPGSGNANKYLVQNATGTAWEAQVPNFSRVQVQTSTALPVPTSGNTVTFTHGFSVVPTEFDAYFVCNTANSQYQVGDRIKTSAVMATGGSVELPAFLLYANATVLGLTQGGSGFPPDRATMNRNDGSVSGSDGDFVGSQWDLYFQAKLIT